MDLPIVKSILTSDLQSSSKKHAKNSSPIQVHTSLVSRVGRSATVEMGNGKSSYTASEMGACNLLCPASTDRLIHVTFTGKG